jgi:hypothetical protein
MPAQLAGTAPASAADQAAQLMPRISAKQLSARAMSMEVMPLSTASVSSRKPVWSAPRSSQSA